MSAEKKMTDENVKLEKIKKSCNAGVKVTNVFFVIAIVCSVLILVAITVILYMGRDFESAVEKGIDAGYVTVGDSVGSVKLFNIELMDAKSIHSDLPALKNLLNERPYTVTVMIYCIIGFIVTVITAVMMKIVGNVFKLIRESESPFTDKVIRRVVIVMIVTAAAAFLTSGLAVGLITLATAWVVYTIMDYGKTLQIQSDETL